MPKSDVLFRLRASPWYSATVRNDITHICVRLFFQNVTKKLIGSPSLKGLTWKVWWLFYNDFFLFSKILLLKVNTNKYISIFKSNILSTNYVFWSFQVSWDVTFFPFQLCTKSLALFWSDMPRFSFSANNFGLCNFEFWSF